MIKIYFTNVHIQNSSDETLVESDETKDKQNKNHVDGKNQIEINLENITK